MRRRPSRRPIAPEQANNPSQKCYVPNRPCGGTLLIAEASLKLGRCRSTPPPARAGGGCFPAARPLGADCMGVLMTRAAAFVGLHVVTLAIAMVLWRIA